MTAEAREATLDFAVRLKDRCDERPPGSNHNQITEWFGFDGPWCDMGCTYVFFHTDQEEEGRHSYTPEHAEAFKERKRLVAVKDLIRGDMFFADFPDSLNRIQHCGYILKRLDNGWFLTMEFNTSSGLSGSQDDGGNAHIRERPPTVIVCGGRPNYNGNVELPVFDIPAKTWFGKGDSGADIKLWKRDLRRWARNLKNPTFDVEEFIDRLRDPVNLFDEDTVKATMTFQYHFSDELDVDGRVGKVTIRKMEKVRTRQGRR